MALTLVRRSTPPHGPGLAGSVPWAGTPRGGVGFGATRHRPPGYGCAGGGDDRLIGDDSSATVSGYRQRLTAAIVSG